MTSTFNGCSRCGCKFTGVDIALVCFCAAVQPAEYCSEGSRRAPFVALCNGSWDLAHGPHNDQRPIEPGHQMVLVVQVSTTGTGTI
jgi:hypothetical protein